MTDVRTLKLATAPVALEQLRQFITYQEALVAQLQKRQGADWAGAFAFAHAEAAKVSGLSGGAEQRLRPLVADFAGRRAAAAEVRARIARAELSAERRQQAEREASRRDDLTDFIERYGEATTQLLREHEATLVALHQQLAKLEGTGHVHPLGSAS